MKNGLKVAALSAAALLLFASCSAKDTTNAASDEAKTQSETAGNASRAKEMDFSDMVVGKVKSIVDNQVTLELGEIDKDAMPERPGGNAPKDGSGDADGDARPEGKTPPEGFSAPEGFTPPEGFSGSEDFTPPEGFSMPEGMTPPEGMSRPDPAEGGFGKQFGGMDLEINYTGETAQYVIPAEIQIGSGDYTSLSEGMVIGITLDENNIVSAVRILSREAK